MPRFGSSRRCRSRAPSSSPRAPATCRTRSTTSRPTPMSPTRSSTTAGARSRTDAGLRGPVGHREHRAEPLRRRAGQPRLLRRRQRRGGGVGPGLYGPRPDRRGRSTPASPNHEDINPRAGRREEELRRSANRSTVDGNGHGTHVAGTIAATEDNVIGVAGVAPDASIAALRALDASGWGSDADIAAAIDWAGTRVSRGQPLARRRPGVAVDRGQDQRPSEHAVRRRRRQRGPRQRRRTRRTRATPTRRTSSASERRPTATSRPTSPTTATTASICSRPASGSSRR